MRRDAREIIDALESGAAIEGALAAKRERINAASAELNAAVEAEAARWLAAGKIVGLVGGDHSTPQGLIAAVARHEGSIGVLHLDAHGDLREAYQGFTHSHASVMYNVLRDVPGVKRLVQVGVRDFSEAEARLAAGHPKVVQYTDMMLSEVRFAGMTWDMQCDEILEHLPHKVYISFDIDFLSPDLCPGTGTPVPGGVSFNEAVWLIRSVIDSGRSIVGFDLCEVAPQTTGPNTGWDANVGARALFRLCGQTLRGVRETLKSTPK
jgi:agmatinase